MAARRFTSSRVKRVALRWGRVLLNDCSRALAARSPHGDKPVFEAHDFAWVRSVEAGFRCIRAELDQVLLRRELIPDFQDISPDQRHLARGAQWKTFFFYAYGYKAAENCARCPITAQLVEAIPGMKTAFFSILAPGAHLRAHRGPYKGVLRYHLGLKVPDPARCRLRVGEHMLGWREGKSVMFDDTYEHEVWNESEHDRVVLFVDVLRPLPWPWSWGNELFVRAVSLTPLVQDGVASFRRLEAEASESPARLRAPSRA
jgi:ornithine lipid ester-linked acyl 2-hydroxylase